MWALTKSRNPSQQWTVGAALHRKGLFLERRAQASVGVRSGALRSSIQVRVVETGQGLEVRATAGTRYARMHHDGTRPHAITPRRPGGRLRFRVAGRVVYAKRVWHPGTRPNRFLSRHLRAALRA